MSWRQERTAILTPSSSSTIVALLSHLVWVAQPWVTLASYPQLTPKVCALVILLFSAHLLPLFFRLFTQGHLLIDGSVEGQYITVIVGSPATTGVSMCGSPLKNAASSPILQQCPLCFFFRLTLIVREMGGRWPYSCCFVASWFLDFCKTACFIFV